MSKLSSPSKNTDTGMVIHKVILKGRLEFGNARSFEKVLKMYEHRLVNYYKMDLLLIDREEDEKRIFDATRFALDVPRLIAKADTKRWKNTVDVLEYLAQFAIAGRFSMWMTEEGTILKSFSIEPDSDKKVVQAFIKGRDLIKENGKEIEAIAALDKAIKRHERHAFAYERRGFIHFQAKNYTEAKADYAMSIDCYPNFPEPQISKAKILILQEKYDEAIVDCVAAIKSTIPLEPIYWEARRLKAECHLALEEYDKAIVELKFFTKRVFTPDNPNYAHRKQAFLNLGEALTQVGEIAEGKKATKMAKEVG